MRVTQAVVIIPQSIQRRHVALGQWERCPSSMKELRQFNCGRSYAAAMANIGGNGKIPLRKGLIMFCGVCYDLVFYANY